MGKVLAFKTIGRGFAPCPRFVFFTLTRRRHFYNYQSHLGFDSRQSLSFSHVDVGDAFKFITDISQRRTNRRSGVGVRRLRSTLAGLEPLHSTTEKRVPGILHQPVHQAYKGGLNLGLTMPITASTGACAACNKLYP